MSELIVAFTVIETAFIATGVAIAYKIARMATHAPLGWWLLVVSFAIGLIRALLNLGADLSSGDMASNFSFAAMVITLPIVIFIFAGVYLFYVDFRSRLGTVGPVS